MEASFSLATLLTVLPILRKHMQHARSGAWTALRLRSVAAASLERLRTVRWQVKRGVVRRDAGMDELGILWSPRVTIMCERLPQSPQTTPTPQPPPPAQSTQITSQRAPRSASGVHLIPSTDTTTSTTSTTHLAESTSERLRCPATWRALRCSDAELSIPPPMSGSKSERGT